MTPAEWTDFKSSLINVNIWIIIPVVVMSVLSHLSRAIRWKILMTQLNYAPKIKNVFAATFVGYLANAAVPRLGEVMKCTILAKYEKLKADKLFGTIILERAFDFICFLLFIGITILIQLDLVGDFFKSHLQTIRENNTITWMNFVISFLIFLTVVFIIRYTIRRFDGNKIIQKIKNFLKGILEGFTSIRKLKAKKAFLFHTFFIWAMYLIQVYVGFYAMETTTGLGIPAAFSVLTLATIAMIATPGGIGSFPIFVMQVLLIYSIPETQGKAFGWLLWGVNTGIVVVGGLISLLLLPYMNKEKRDVAGE